MKLLLAALTIWTLPFFGMSCNSASVQEPASERATETITLTNQKATGSFPLRPDLLKNPPPALLVQVTKVVNPSARAVTVFVYLSRPSEKRDIPAEKIDIGNFSLYPADRPGTFTLNPTTALRKAAESNNDSNSKAWRIVFELEQKAEQGSAALEITIAEPIGVITKG